MKKVFWLVLSFFFATLFFLIWQGVEVVGYGYKIDRLRSEMVCLQAENVLIREEYCSLTSFKKIEEIASSELGMVYPRYIRYVRAGRPGKN